MSFERDIDIRITNINMIPGSNSRNSGLLGLSTEQNSDSLASRAMERTRVSAEVATTMSKPAQPVTNIAA